MAKKRGPAQEAPSEVEAGKDLFDIKRLDPARKGHYAKGYGMKKVAFRKRRKMAQDYVAPGDGGWG